MKEVNPDTALYNISINILKTIPIKQDANYYSIIKQIKLSPDGNSSLVKKKIYLKFV